MPNRLAKETSPYLLQHKNNPVDWYPWGDEAFAAAKKLDRPIFLSVGYSACHWCHVMDDVTYKDPQVVKLLNEHFVVIRADQDANPDLSSRYGDRGWPATFATSVPALPRRRAAGASRRPPIRAPGRLSRTDWC